MATRLNDLPGDAGYEAQFDVDGSGNISISDLIAVATRLNDVLPVGNPSGPDPLAPEAIDSAFDRE